MDKTEKILTMLLIVGAILADSYLEIKGIKVPAIILILAGFGVRHIVGDSSSQNTSVDTTTTAAEAPPLGKIGLSLVICMLLVGLSGCASAGLNGGCMHLNGTGSYAGSVNGDLHGCVCHIGCLGFSCPKSDYTALAAMETACVNSAAGVTTTVPLTVAVTPTGK